MRPQATKVGNDLDFCLRYALWRLCRVARGQDSLAGRMSRLRLEGHAGAWTSGVCTPYLRLEDRDGEVLERVLCLGAHAVLESSDLSRGLLVAGQISATSAQAPCRFLSGAWLWRRPAGPGFLDLTDSGERQAAIRQSGGESLEGPHLLWDLGVHRRDRLTSEVAFHLADGGAREPGRTYLGLYYSLRRTLADGHPLRVEELPRIHLLHLFGELPGDCEVPELPRVAEVAFWRETLVKPPVPLEEPPPYPIDRISTALRRGLFDETEISLADLYVHQEAHLQWPNPEKNLSWVWMATAPGLLFRWLSEAIVGRWEGEPLLVLGSFGSGKSSLLTMFAQLLLEEKTSILPILVPLRDLRDASPGRPLAQVVTEHVLRRWSVDLDAPASGGRRYILLCDGFDELNLYYLAVESAEWVSECFRSLASFSERPHIEVVISSRSILLMDAERHASEAAEAPKVHLSLFKRDEVNEWCTKYRRAIARESFIDDSFLVERNLFEVAQTPLILYLLARLLEQDERVFETPRRYTRAEVYRMFIDKTCAKGGYEKERRKHKVPANYRAILQEIARFYFEKGTSFVAEHELLEALRKVFGSKTPDNIPVARNLLVAHVLQPIEGESRQDTQNLIEFTHQSFREYLTAEWVWARLAPARRGRGLEPAVWSGIPDQGFSATEMRFLAELMSELSWEEAESLYEALSGTERLDQYWMKWLRPLWEAAFQAPGRETLRRIQSRVKAIASWAANLATLGFLLRAKAFARLQQLADEGNGRTLPVPLEAELLDRLLHHFATYPGPGAGGGNLPVLLDNLDGLVLGGKALQGHQLTRPNLKGSRLRGINFSGSRWLEVDVRRADFAGASFFRARLLDLRFEDCTFAGNRWEGASSG